MKLKLVLSVLVVFCLLSLRPALAREWTDSSGTYKIEAELVKLDGKVVHLKKADGAIIKVPLDKLSGTDRQFLAEPSYQQGMRAYKKNDFDLAISCFNEAIRLAPSYAVVYGSRGFTYYIKGQKEKAITDYSEAIRLKSDYALAYCQRGVAYLNSGDPDKAVADLTEAIRLKPDYAEAISNRRLAYEQKDRKARASASSPVEAASQQSLKPVASAPAQPEAPPPVAPSGPAWPKPAWNPSHSSVWNQINQMSPEERRQGGWERVDPNSPDSSFRRIEVAPSKRLRESDRASMKYGSTRTRTGSGRGRPSGLSIQTMRKPRRTTWLR